MFYLNAMHSVHVPKIVADQSSVGEGFMCYIPRPSPSFRTPYVTTASHESATSPASPVALVNVNYFRGTSKVL